MCTSARRRREKNPTLLELHAERYRWDRVAYERDGVGGLVVALGLGLLKSWGWICWSVGIWFVEEFGVGWLKSWDSGMVCRKLEHGIMGATR